MPQQIKIRNGTATEWTSANPVLAKGEMGLETDTNKFKFGDGATAWNSLAYVATGGGTIYANPIDEPPASPSAWDDEFAGTSLDAKWAQMRSSVLTIDSTVEGICSLKSSDWWSGIYQAIPSGDFTATAKVTFFWGAGDVWAGLLVGSATGDSPAMRGIEIHANSSPLKAMSTYWNNPTSWNSDPANQRCAQFGYLRIKRVGTTLNFYYSIDGRRFQLVQTFTQPFTPATIGLYAGKSMVDYGWFRVTEP